MKGLFYFLCGMLLMFFQSVKSQTSLTVTDEAVGQAECADEQNTNALRYYFFPNLDAYFDLKDMVYVFKQNGVWVREKTIAPNYRGYSLFNKYRVLINDYFGDEPYEKLNEHKKMYPHDYTGRLQKMAMMKKLEEEKKLSMNEGKMK